MGCYDTLLVNCLFCGKEIEEQTKSGDCLFQYYKFDEPDLPTWVMQDFNGLEWNCYFCDRIFRTVYEVEVKVIVGKRKLEPIINLDMLELKSIEKDGGIDK